MSYSRTRATTGKKIASKSSKKTLSNKITDPTHMEKYVHAYEQRQYLLSNIDKINKNITYNTNELQSLPNDSSELSGSNYDSMEKVNDDRNSFTYSNSRLQNIKQKQLQEARVHHKNMRMLEKKYKVADNERLARTSMIGEKKAYSLDNSPVRRFYGGKKKTRKRNIKSDKKKTRKRKKKTRKRNMKSDKKKTMKRKKKY